jgi:hypothetical protein
VFPAGATAGIGALDVTFDGDVAHAVTIVIEARVRRVNFMRSPWREGASPR